MSLRWICLGRIFGDLWRIWGVTFWRIVGDASDGFQYSLGDLGEAF